MVETIHANIRPFLRWAGSKRKLLKHLIPLVPANFNKYYEPFLGGGSLFFYLGPINAEISDISGHLIRIYHSVRSSPEQILEYLKPLKPDREHFDRLKETKEINNVEESARLIFLNKACWNGLFRVNSDGIFNVPFGKPKTNFIIDEHNFRRCSKRLQERGVRILRQDFQAIENRVRRNDFIFCDPPYVTSHNHNGFADWNERLFSWNDQIRLASMAHRLVRRGAHVLVTNADHPDVHALYQGFCSCTYSRQSTLASDAARRTATSEAIFFGGPGYADTPFTEPTAGTFINGSQRRTS